MPLPDNALDRLRAAFVSTDSAIADGAPALRLQATGAQTFSSMTISGTNAITFTAASAEIIPGATSLLFRNNADNATNLSITDAGVVTIRAGLTLVTTAPLTFGEGGNIAAGTTTGTKIGTDAAQKLGVWNAAPIVQPTTGVAAATFVANTSLIANDTATFDGYTLGQVVKALRNIGLLA